jgi:hypothetical protein
MNTFQIRKSDATDVDVSPTEAIQPPANDHGNGSKQRSERADVVRENRTTPHAREHLGNDHEKTASQGRERGKTERGGFEPPVRIISARRFSKPLVSATHPPLQTLPGHNHLPYLHIFRCGTSASTACSVHVARAKVSGALRGVKALTNHLATGAGGWF